MLLWISAMPTPNTQAAIDFLQQWEPTGPWTLTAITTDKQSIITEPFTEDQIEELTDFLKEHNGERNLYFQVNPSINLDAKKSLRANIKALAWLHVDIDPREGEDMEDERSRALEMLRNPPSDVPPPTVIIDSGGGYQGFWALEDPFPIEGTPEKYEEAKRWNLQLEMIFGADNCHNVDRIMRLPGTVNLPDARKKAKGRKQALAELVEFNESRVYPLSTFRQAHQVQTQMDGGAFSSGAKAAVEITGSVQRLADLDELNQWNVPDRVKVIIVQGREPNEGPKPRDDSRSAWLFDCLCNLARCEVPDEVIFSIVTDPDLGISASVLDKGSEADNYALRQMGRAKEHAIDPRLVEMNDRHAVILNCGGKCLVVEEIEESVGFKQNRSRLTFQSFTDIKNRYCNIQVVAYTGNKGDVTEPLGNWWLKHSNRRQYQNIVFRPGMDTPDQYNLWRGFACAAKPGDCSKFLGHLERNLCKGNKAYYQYLIGWMARCVQDPASPGHIAIVLRGQQGVGKSFFAKQFGSLFGRHFLQVSDPKHLVGSFNAHLRDCVVLFGDEAFFAGDKRHESVLKTLITEEMIQVERKGVDVEAQPNFTHLILASNSQWVIPAGANERRYFVLDVSDDHRQEPSYFKGIIDQMNKGGREALLDYLLNYDLSKFEVRNVPRTEALREQRHLSLAPEAEWWFKCLQDGRILGKSDDWPVLLRTEVVQGCFVNYAKEFNIKHHTNHTTLGQFLSRMCPGLDVKQRRVPVPVKQEDGTVEEIMLRKRCYIFPSLGKCRQQWDKEYGEEFWPEIDIETEADGETDAF